jgi:hypothetical protein
LAGLKALVARSPLLTRGTSDVQSAPQKQSEIASSVQDYAALNDDYLNKATFGDGALRKEIIELYVAQLGLFRRGLLKPVNSATWKYMTHTLKGASAAVGADQMNAIARLWEKQATPETPDAREAILLAFDDVMERFREAL